MLEIGAEGLPIDLMEMVDVHFSQLLVGEAGEFASLEIGLANLALEVSDEDGVYAVFEELAVAAAGLLDLLEDLGALNGGPGEIADALEDGEIFFTEAVFDRIDGFEDADELILGADGRAGDGFGAEAGVLVDTGVEAGVLMGFVDDDGLAVGGDPASDALALFNGEADDILAFLASGGAENDVLGALVEQGEGNGLDLEGLGGFGEDGLEDLVEVEGGGDGAGSPQPCITTAPASTPPC